MRFSFILNQIKVFNGTVNEEFEELMEFISNQGIIISDRILLSKENINELLDAYNSFLNNKIKLNYVPQFNELSGWDEFNIDGKTYKLFPHTSERKKLRYFFVFYETINNPQLNTLEIKKYEEREGTDYGSIQY